MRTATLKSIFHTRIEKERKKKKFTSLRDGYRDGGALHEKWILNLKTNGRRDAASGLLADRAFASSFGIKKNIPENFLPTSAIDRRNSR